MLRTANIGVCDIREAAARERAASTAGNRPLFYFRFGEHNEYIFSSPYLSVTVPHLEASGRRLHQYDRRGAASDKAGQPKDNIWKAIIDFSLPKSEVMGRGKEYSFLITFEHVHVSVASILWILWRRFHTISW